MLPPPSGVPNYGTPGSVRFHHPKEVSISRGPFVVEMKDGMGRRTEGGRAAKVLLGIYADENRGLRFPGGSAKAMKAWEPHERRIRRRFSGGGHGPPRHTKTVSMRGRRRPDRLVPRGDQEKFGASTYWRARRGEAISWAEKIVDCRGTEAVRGAPRMD